MIWKERGVDQDSYMCFFDPSKSFKDMFFYMVSCGYFHTNSSYLYDSSGNRPPLLVYVINGSLNLDYEGRTFTAHSDNIFLINCRKPNRYYCTETCEFLFFHFDGTQAALLSDQLILGNRSPLFSASDHSEIYRIIREPVMKLCYQEEYDDARLSSLVYAVLTELHQDTAKSKEPVPALSGIIRSADEYIRAHIHETISLEALSAHVGLSPFYFSRYFKKETGISPIEYASITKINYAKLMLRTTNASIQEISDYLGYSSPASFINAFKRRRGISPNKYRNLKR